MAKDMYSNINVEDADEICRRIKEEAASQVNDILGKARQEKQRILDEALKDSENKRQGSLKQLGKELERLKQRVFSTINLEKKKLYLEGKGELINAVIDRVKGMAAEIRNSADYRGFLEKAILEGVKIIDQNELDILYSLLDDNIFKNDFINTTEKLCQERLDHKISLNFKKADFKDIGIIAQSVDQRLIYDNRFLARLKRAYDEVYMNLLKESL